MAKAPNPTEEQTQAEAQPKQDSRRQAKSDLAAAKARVKAERPFYKKPWFWIVGVVVFAVIASLGGGEEDAAPSAGGGEEQQQSGGGGSETVGIGVPAEPDMTVSQENAIEAAESYLDTSGFSKEGLIGQLSSKFGEGFPKKDAIFAVSHVDVDWNKEAVESAKSYLETSSFSRQGLIDQLSSPHGEQFTKAQAVYAVNQVGL